MNDLIAQIRAAQRDAGERVVINHLKETMTSSQNDPRPGMDDTIGGDAREKTHFLQPKIEGYRQLTEAEVALANEGKALAVQCGKYIEKLRGQMQADGQPALDQRWISIGATDLQKGFMCLIRGILQPTTF